MITAVILHYKRPEYLPRAIASLRAQTVPCEIWVWDNSGDAPECGQDHTIRSTINLDCLPRVLLIGACRTEYYYTQDDDMELLDNGMLEKMVREIEIHPDAVIGFNGKHPDDVIDWAKPHKGVRRETGECPVINTGILFGRTAVLSRLALNPYHALGLTQEEYRYGDDLAISKQLEEKRLIGVQQTIRMMDKESGLCLEDRHLPIRHRMMREWWGP